MKKLLFSIGLLALMLCLSSTAYADSKKKKQAKDVGTTMTLVTSGTGSTKEEATKNALRSALEQTYGAFVSANSSVVNDELVKDEIVSISSGNIVEYEELSFQDTNPKQVMVKSVVSITKLANYAQNKGMAVELAGNTFAMNMKMEELNKQNQSKALEHLFDEASSMYDRLFDYEIKVSSPENYHGKIQVPITINIKANKNTIMFYDMIHNTLKSLAVGIKSDVYSGSSNEIGFEFSKASNYGINKEAITYVLRGDNTDETGNDVRKFSMLLDKIVAFGIFNFEVVDNLGNVSGPVPTTYNDSRNKEVVYSGNNTYFCLSNKLTTKDYGRGGGNTATLRTLRSIRRLGKQLTGDRIQEQVYSNDLASGQENIMNHWMNKMKPTEGEDLYSWKLYLRYSADEIAKVSKIEIRPKVIEKDGTSPKDVVEVYDRAREQHKLDPNMEKGLAKPYYQQLIQLLASKSNRVKAENTILVTSYHYMMYYAHTHGDSSAAVEYAEKILAIDPSYDAAIAMKEYYSNK